MDVESGHAIRFLEALARSNSCLRTLAQRLRTYGEVTSVTTSFFCWQYESPRYPFLEQYVEAEMRNGKGLTWTLEVTWDEEQWRISYEVAEQGEHQISLIQFPERSSQSLDGLITELETATRELVGAEERIDYTVYGAA
jgi:hypothetical protein